MIKKHFLPIALILTMVFSTIVLSGCSDNSSEIYSNNGELVASLNRDNIYELENINPIHMSYIEAVFNEATELIAKLESISTEQAQQLLTSSEYRIDTYLDTQAVKLIDSIYKNSEISSQPFGCVITNMNGSVVAMYSNENEDNINFSLQRQSPYSTLKPLSVYAQALEKGIINWSSMYKDSPYKQIKDTDGELTDWPENAMGTYENKNITVYQGLCESLNTTAVKVLSDSGVVESISFLKENFDMPLDFELEKALTQGEEEVIGNVAMGYTYSGLSVLEMAGYYRVFADSGKYSAPKTIKRITSENGDVIYEHVDKPVQVFSEDTAYIMNRMLCGVVLPGGTGLDATISGVEVSGKTGTGSANDGHWFVGEVPQYSCAVWHGGIIEDNYSPELFSKIVSGLKLDENAGYPYCGTVIQQLYCCDSGLLAGHSCPQVEIGYYSVDDEIASCGIHK